MRTDAYIGQDANFGETVDFILKTPGISMVAGVFYNACNVETQKNKNTGKVYKLTLQGQGKSSTISLNM